MSLIGMILGKSICIAPDCKQEVFGTFCKEHSKFVQVTPDEWMQLGMYLMIHPPKRVRP